MNSIEIGFWDTIIPISKKARSNGGSPKKSRKKANPDEVVLAFYDRQKREPIEEAPIHEIVMNAPPEEMLSYEPTRRVPVRNTGKLTFDGATVATRLSAAGFKKAQTLMVISSSFLGLLIGIFIAFFVK
ncbi:MAG: hypothetical protein WA110_04345 [Anaerolineaceae bacterium]